MSKLLFVLAFIVAISTITTYSAAQGTVTTQGNPYACPITQGNGEPTGWVNGTTCQNATVTSCSGATDMPFTFGYLSPTAPYKGTIVILNGAGGTTPNDADAQPLTFGPYYVSQGYEIVQVAWLTPWEDTQGTSGADVATAACRPSTFLSWAHGNPLLFQGTPQNGAGMCAQGTSAGSAAIAYSLIWYNAGSYLDKVELLSGPVLSDIEQGCEVNANGPPPDVNVCPATETQCHRGSLQPWSETPQYVDGYAFGPRNWTGDNNCKGANVTTVAEDYAWLNQSIDAPVPGNGPPPNTDITGWLCANVYGGGPMNNSSSQGQLFYTFLGTGSTFDIFAVSGCQMAEGVTGPNAQVPGLANLGGLTAIETDMVSGLSANGYPTSTKCQLNHH